MTLQVDPSEAWLRDNCDNTAYFPQDGNFNLQTHGLSEYTTLVVEGPSITAAPPRSNLPPSMTLTSTPSSSSGFQNFRSVTAPRRSPSFSLKVLKAKMYRNGRRKLDFQTLGQTYIEISEATANLEHILGMIYQRWGNGYKVVTSDGVPLEDSPTTQGELFYSI